MSAPTRILALLTDGFGAAGGIAAYNRDFVAALSASGAEIEIAPRRGVGAGGLPARVRQHPAIHDRLRYALRAVGVAVARRPRIVFCGHLYMAPLAAIAARLAGARLVIQLHGVEIWPRPTAQRLAALEAADLILCVSRDTRARAIGWANIAPERAVVVPNTVSDVFTPGDASALRQRLGLQGELALLSVGRLDARERYKGHDRVIRLLRAARARGHDAVYLVAGEGDDRARLEALAASEGVAEHVRFLGPTLDADLPDLYRAADLFVMPSTGEGFGIVFLEAMACGTPALGLAAGGAPDALEGLGEAVAEAALPAALMRALAADKPNGGSLAARVRERFGRPVFEARVAEVMAAVGLAGGAPGQAVAR
ncbi:MAG TPA: glycosyltransferase family 4 protein [Caulobacteraceae bacterium]|jgi:phosphatidylinositol alpha-1,6-mannosyltransferase